MVLEIKNHSPQPAENEIYISNMFFQLLKLDNKSDRKI